MGLLRSESPSPTARRQPDQIDPTRRARLLALPLALIALTLPACNKEEEQHKEEHHTIVVTSPKVKDVVLTEQFVCQMRSQRHISVRSLSNGYLMEIPIREGQEVKKDTELFKILPTLYKAKWDAEVAEARLAELELNNTRRLFEQKVVSQNEVALFEAKLEKARAKAEQAKAELNFTTVRAPFDGIVDRLHEQHGSLIKEGDNLTTLSDNSVMWVYFNVPETRYYEYKSQEVGGTDPSRLKLKDSRIELILADGSKFPQSGGDTVTVEGKFNPETGTIPFRADFRNPTRLLRHGQTGNIRVSRMLRQALVIPQRATFEVLDRQYVYVVDKDDVVRQRDIVVEHEMDDIFVIRSGLDVNDRIVLEGVRQVHAGQKLEGVEFRKPEEALRDLKYHAE